MFDGHECNAVLDWSESDVGDRHADIAATLVLIRSAPVELPRIRHKIAALVGKHLLEHWYLQTYRKHVPIDDHRLHPYLAWAALRRLCAWGRWLHAGPLITGGQAVVGAAPATGPDRFSVLAVSEGDRDAG
jgi:aminoglycoside phosphotransferase (APT) family kinase protein